MTSILIVRGGSVFDPGSGQSRAADIEVIDNTIRAVRPDLPVPPGADVLEAAGRLVLPGFVDAHRHTWQAVLRGIAPDVTLEEYLDLCLRTLGPRFTPEELALGNLVGALECLDAGITTVFDWSHLQLTPAHTDAAIDGLRRSGIRALFGYARLGQADSRLTDSEVRRVAAELDHDPLVSLAIGAAGPEMSAPEQVRHEWSLARETGARISAHVGGSGPDSAARGLDLLTAEGLLGDDLLLSHANGYDDVALRRVADAGAAIVVSPTIEPVMGHGFPVTGRALAAGVATGLGADVVTSGPGDLFSVMRAAYLLDRARTGTGEDALTALDTLRLATTGGAAAVGLSGRIGTPRPGSAADLVLLRTDLPGTAPVHDAVATAVLAADTRAVEAVVVAGRVVKRDGQLVGHDLPALAGALREAAARITAVSGSRRPSAARERSAPTR
jgi:cytosine/adenosine deaminase-related metal-dependent hydrolase